ncbi:hypothetical protein JOL62DRAFT_607670 [Phyllosticta paracitricarpa]|uniref:Uncharacterized protein n=1 Tax=Phyllosticta paracitricarpa TaxID=2016321 RepID=A0ABR1MUA8_9PEZI
MEWHLVAPEPRQTGKTDRANQQLLLDAFLAHVCLCCMTWRPYSVFSPHLNTTHLSPSSPLRPSMTDTVQQQNRERIWRACDNKDGHDPAAVAQIWRWMARTRFSADTPASACRELLAIFNLAPNSGMNAEQHMKALETALLQRIRGNELKHLQDHGLIDAAGCWDGDTVRGIKQQELVDIKAWLPGQWQDVLSAVRAVRLKQTCHEVANEMRDDYGRRFRNAGRRHEAGD